jgi:hypothetical protein
MNRSGLKRFDVGLAGKALALFLTQSQTTNQTKRK